MTANFEPGMIVRSKLTGELYEIKQVFGTFSLCRKIKEDASLESDEIPIPNENFEVILDESTNAFNILFEGK